MNRLSVVGRPKNAGARDDNFRSGAHYPIDVVRFYAAVGFDEDGQFLLVEKTAGYLFQRHVGIHGD